MTNTRKVALLTQTGRIEMRRLPMPVPGPEDVLIRIRAVGVCGSDVSYFRNGRTGVGAIRFPHILGHECAGVVEAAGSRVRTLKAGDPVCIEPGYFCGKCPQCTQGNYNLCRDMSFMGSAVAHDYGEGALVEYSLRPAHLTFKLPENVGFDLGAMVEPLSVGLQAVRSGRVPAGGITAERVYRMGKGSGICQSYIAVDYGLFGDKACIRHEFSEYLRKLRESQKAEGKERIYTHGETEFESRILRREKGIPINEKTLSELQKIAASLGDAVLPFPAEV